MRLVALLIVGDCVTEPTAQYCGGALLDTGCPVTKVEWVTYTGPAVTWPAATSVDISVGTLDDYAFSVGATPTPGIDDVMLEPGTGTDLINLGTTIFFRDDVLFDQRDGVIGLASAAARGAR